MTKRLLCPPAPGPLEAYAERFDDCLGTVAQRRGFREYLQGLLLPRDRHKTLTGLVGTEPVVGAQAPSAQRLQFFLSESTWDAEAITRRRLELVVAEPATAPHAGGVLLIDDSGDRKAGTKTAHVARQYLGSIGKVDSGIVAVTSLWADERISYPLHVRLYTPAERLPQGKADPAFHTKPQLAVELVDAARDAGFSFRAVVADCCYGENATFEGALTRAGLPYVVALKPSSGSGRRPMRSTRRRRPRGSCRGAAPTSRATGRRSGGGSATATRRPGGPPTSPMARMDRAGPAASWWPRLTRPRCRR